MNNPKHSITYIVFKGRKLGLYSSQIDCYAQVNKFKPTDCRVFNTMEEAEAAWQAMIQGDIASDQLHGIQITNAFASPSNSNIYFTPISYYLQCVNQHLTHLMNHLLFVLVSNFTFPSLIGTRVH